MREFSGKGPQQDTEVITLHESYSMASVTLRSVARPIFSPGAIGIRITSRSA